MNDEEFKLFADNNQEFPDFYTFFLLNNLSKRLRRDDAQDKRARKIYKCLDKEIYENQLGTMPLVEILMQEVTASKQWIDKR